MAYSPELLEELKILCLFNLATTQEGIKVHSNAEPEAVAATQRLHDKGLITLSDGGYLTSLGHDAARYAQDLLTILETTNVTS
ncbi:hypothetical protein L861_12045 [Litchfieldella anticariensis FP35 = DSM 16096]|uniref:DNA-binding protein n=1 Tax=Litchfieldella anticariensis (strain DSM 16096 / CECT 5854 / CIP 108499 / LMG 22089 / FP35) TaxID=1121939 RepID=S2KLH4_LITA3|nr:TIGR02647 family protein [Halomonas anticariensis]EPC01298.1 hypothetical protein L861_12045 [Halomonas anticariensis FP35 = DSM 16096]